MVFLSNRNLNVKCKPYWLIYSLRNNTKLIFRLKNIFLKKLFYIMKQA